jgi:hypothetical protein
MARDQLYMQQLSYDRPDEWQDKANCRDKTLELFEYTEKDSPLAKGMNFKERMAFNEANFGLAEEICIECPVMFDCKSNATEDEKFWTVRGGEPPARYLLDPERYANVGRPAGGTNGVPADRVCVHGHHVKGGGDCKECRAEANRKYRHNASVRPKPKAGEDFICQRGHKVIGGGRCKKCKQQKDATRHGRSGRRKTTPDAVQ